MLTDVLAKLTTDPRFARHITHWRRLPPEPARYADRLPPLDERLIAVLRARGLDRLYVHQASAVEAALAGQHVVVVTPTASGKTLCYNLPVLNALLADPAARTLYLFPTKALAQDQLAELQRWQRVLGTPLNSATYDGDTPTTVRAAVRRDARIVVTNPDMLHTGILPHHTRWSALFGGLRCVVVDEIHSYRGVFGSHVANVIRRLKRIARFYGASPQFICASATIANPRELAEALIEEDVVLINDDGSPKGERHFLFYNPPIVDRALHIRRNPVLEAQTLAQEFIEQDVQTIVFARSRLATELLVHYLQPDNPQSAIRNPQSAVRGYRGGYLPAERREIEKGVRDGTVRCVVATNALELGIDVGQLDASLMVGYPGTVASTWQQAGRAGRRAGVSAAILIAGGNPLEQYIVTHPGYFFGRSPEHGRINPDNLLILLAHLKCAAFELPFADGETFGRYGNLPYGRYGNLPYGRAETEQGPGGPIDPSTRLPTYDTAELLEYLAESGFVHHAGTAWYWLADAYPAEAISLRSAGPDRVLILDTSDGTTRTIGEVERAAAPAMVHPGAVYLHASQSYQVERLDWEAGQAFVRLTDADFYTQASVSVEVRPVEVREQAARAGATISHGEVRVTSKATGFRQIRFYTHETLGWGEINLPEQTLDTTAYWFVLSEATVDRLRQAGWWRFDPVGYRGPNWQVQRDAARARDGYRCRHCGAPERPGRQHDIHHLTPFRDFGYVPGQNIAYREANLLDNLVTLCRNCHRRAENAQRFQGALTGLGHVLGHLVPLFLMCDWRDVGILAESQAAWSRAPTVTIYEKVPAGVGFADQLYTLHDDLLAAARELIVDCPCERGCPSCVGPVDEVGEDAKAYTLAILGELSRAY
jgi:DEAD/DEAH box helicase domain-containing protein